MSKDFSFAKFANNDFYKKQNESLVDLADLKNDTKVIDLACATGGVTKIIAQKMTGAKKSIIFAIDHSASALKIAKEDLHSIKTAAIQFVQSQVENVSDSVKENVDAVFFCNAIHYINDKDTLIDNISKTLKPGGKLAFNTSFYEGSHPSDSLLFYKKWMFKAAKTLKRNYGMLPKKENKVESRIHLTPEEYQEILERKGFILQKQNIARVMVPISGWLDISEFKDFIEGAMPGVPLKEASLALQTAVRETFKDLAIETVPRNWLEIVAVKK